MQVSVRKVMLDADIKAEAAATVTPREPTQRPLPSNALSNIHYYGLCHCPPWFYSPHPPLPFGTSLQNQQTLHPSAWNILQGIWMLPSLLSKNFCLYIFPSIPTLPAYSRKTHIIEDASHCRLLREPVNPILAKINFQRLVYSKPFVEGIISRITVSLGTIIIFSVSSQHPSTELQLLQQLHLHLSHPLPWSSFLQFGLKCPSHNLFPQRQ